MCCTHWALGASEEHPGLSGPDLQMSSPGTARLGRHYHSSSSNLLTASPYSSSWTFHWKRMQVRTEMNSPWNDVAPGVSASVYVEQK